MIAKFQKFIKPDNSGVLHGTWNKPDAISLYPSYLENAVGWTNIEDWYGLTERHLKSNYGIGLYQKCGKSRFAVIKTLFPKYDWLEWKMTRQPVGYWNMNSIVEVTHTKDNSNKVIGKITKYNMGGTYDVEYENGNREQKVDTARVKIIYRTNVRKYADWLFIKLGFDKQECWYGINVDMIVNNYGHGMLFNYFSGSPIDFIRSTYPEYDWEEWKFNRVRQGYWDDTTNHVKFALSLAKQYNYARPEDWYKITIKHIVDHGGNGLLSLYYNTSPIRFINEVVSSIFPDYEWNAYSFDNLPKHWHIFENRIQFAYRLGNVLGYTKPEHWYKLKLYMIIDNDGAGLVGGYYDRSPQKFVFCVIQTIYPDYVWLPWKFDLVPNNFWKELSNQKLYADWLGKELGYTKHEDWYDVTLQQIKDNNGGGLVVGYYGGSSYNFLKSVYPEYIWMPWKFITKTSGHAWKDIENRRLALIEFEKQQGFTKHEDWYHVNRETLRTCRLLSMVTNYYNTSLSRCITELFPEYNLTRTKFKRNYSTGSIQWLEYLKVSMPDMRHILNNNYGEFIIPNTKYKADGFSHINNCVFEYHGDFWHGNPAIYNPDDMNQVSNITYGELYNKTLIKQLYCEENGFMYKSIWESEWIRGKNALIMLQQIFRRRYLDH